MLLETREFSALPSFTAHILLVARSCHSHHRNAALAIPTVQASPHSFPQAVTSDPSVVCWPRASFSCPLSVTLLEPPLTVSLFLCLKTPTTLSLSRVVLHNVASPSLPSPGFGLLTLLHQLWKTSCSLC